MKDLVIIGASETACRIVSFVNRYQLFNIVGCAVDDEYINGRTSIELGSTVLPLYSISNLGEVFDMDRTLVFVAILWNRLNADRRDLYRKIKAKGYKCANIISPSASFRGKSIGENCLISDLCCVQEDVSIGNNVWIMDSSILGHMSVCDDHVFISPGATVLGASRIGQQTFIGARATVFDETIIGEKCLIGAMVAVNRNVPPCSVVKINPAISTTIKHYSEDEIESKWLAHYNVR